MAPEFLAAASELCDLYSSASTEERAEIRSNITWPGAGVMGGFARIMSIEVIRQNSPDLVQKALVTLSIRGLQAGLQRLNDVPLNGFS